MSRDKFKPPPELIHKLTRSKEPYVAVLKGPGPFRLPPLTAVEGTVQAPQGHVAIALETKTAQEVHIVLTEQAAVALFDILGAYFEIQKQNAPNRKN